MTELDETLAEISSATFEDDRFTYETPEGQYVVRIDFICPQTNGLAVKLLAFFVPNCSGTISYEKSKYNTCGGGLLPPGQERLKLLRELAATWEHLHVQAQGHGTSLTRPKGRPFLKVNRLRSKGILTQPLSPSIEVFVQRVLDNQAELVHRRKLQTVRKAFERVDLSLEEITNIWREVQVERIHNS